MKPGAGDTNRTPPRCSSLRQRQCRREARKSVFGRWLRRIATASSHKTKRVLDGHDLGLRAAGEAHRRTTDEVVHRRNKCTAYALHKHRQRERATLGSRNRPELLPGLRQRLSKRPDGKADRSGGRSVCRFQESNGPDRRSLVALRRFLLSLGLPLPSPPPPPPPPHSPHLNPTRTPQRARFLSDALRSALRLTHEEGAFPAGLVMLTSSVCAPTPQLAAQQETARPASARCIPSPLFAISMNPSARSCSISAAHAVLLRTYF